MEEFFNPERIQLRNLNEIKAFKFNDEGQQTKTSIEQIKVENTIEQIYNRFEQLAAMDISQPLLNRKKHAEYLENMIKSLPQHFECLDASRTWLVYWLLHAATLLSVRFSDQTYDSIVEFLKLCRDPNGGFGGGPNMLPHLAPTYAAVNALCIVGTEAAYEAIDKPSLKRFLLSLRQTDGSFRMHEDGEIDVRGVYCAISSAKLVNISKHDEEILFKNTATWIADCQTYEGGFGGVPGAEAHGGYSFCAAAALAMLGTTAHTDLQSLLRWTVFRQMPFEGGFQGRTNKLVDGCYSYWMGSLVPIVQALIAKENCDVTAFMKKPLFHREALQEYILICCQRPNGGLIDKPGKPADPYHTCYNISGLAIAQHCDNRSDPLVIGPSSNEVLPTHPVHNIVPKAVLGAYSYFQYNDGYDDDLKSENEDASQESSINTIEMLFKTPSDSTVDRSMLSHDESGSRDSQSSDISSLSSNYVLIRNTDEYHQSTMEREFQK